jgi:Tfp pilus assembly protein FimT
MALLVIMLGFAAPSLSRFFRGRTLDSEARRMLALTRYGQSRAVSEGVPMLLWIDPKLGTYGLKAQTGYTDRDQKAVEYTLGQDLQMEVQMSPRVQTNFWTMAPKQSKLNQPTICFLPDGFISETSPDRILLRETRDNDAVWIGASANHLAYEIQTNQYLFAR